MCGRFTSMLSPELIEVIFGVHAPPGIVPQYNIAPTQHVWTVRQASTEGRFLSHARWGLVPSWAKDISIGNRMINARCETVHEKPAFRLAIRARRCIIPASGFFEWSATAAGKLPHYVTMRDDSPMAFAGIWDVWKNPSGESIESCAILTTAANSLVEPLHDRMPVILHRTEFDLWLDRTENDPRKLQRLYQPYPAGSMQMWEVSPMVNKPSHDTAENIVPVKVSL